MEKLFILLSQFFQICGNITSCRTHFSIFTLPQRNHLQIQRSKSHFSPNCFSGKTNLRQHNQTVHMLMVVASKAKSTSLKDLRNCLKFLITKSFYISQSNLISSLSVSIQFRCKFRFKLYVTCSDSVCCSNYFNFLFHPIQLFQGVKWQERSKKQEKVGIFSQKQEKVGIFHP